MAEEIAVQLANQFPDGVLFVCLAPISDSALAVTSILRTLGGEQEPASASEESLVSRLQALTLLLILDNLEQLLAAASSIQEVLVRCPGVTCLVTSRVLLQIRGEFEFKVEPLATTTDESSPAVQLLRDRLRTALPAGQLLSIETANAARICERGDGLPLAIELAAAQLRSMSPDDLMIRLHDPSALGRGPRDLPDYGERRRLELRSPTTGSSGAVRQIDRIPGRVLA